MTEEIQQQVEIAVDPQELSEFRRQWWVFLVLGALLIIGGVFCISYPLVTSAGVMVFLGATMIISGALMIVSAFWTGKWSGFFLQILAGLFYFVSGFIIADRPIASAAIFTLMIAAFLIVTGGIRILYSLMERFYQWGWVLANGVISLLMGVIILKSFKSLETSGPAAVVWIIGLVIGIELIFCGVTFLMLSFAVKKLPKVEEAT